MKQGILLNPSKRESHKLSEQVINCVIEFYQDDVSSRLCAGKKDGFLKEKIGYVVQANFNFVYTLINLYILPNYTDSIKVNYYKYFFNISICLKIYIKIFNIKYIPKLNHMLRISKPVSLLISLYLETMCHFLLAEKLSSCNAGWVRNAIAQWKKLFQAWCSNWEKKKSLIVCEKKRRDFKITLE